MNEELRDMILSLMNEEFQRKIQKSERKKKKRNGKQPRRHLKKSKNLKIQNSIFLLVQFY